MSCKFLTLDERFDRADVVVIAKIDAIVPSANDTGYDLVFLKEEILKGSIVDVFKLIEPKSNWTHPFSNNGVGSEYLLFLKSGQDSIGICDPSHLLNTVSTNWLDSKREPSG